MRNHRNVAGEEKEKLSRQNFQKGSGEALRPLGNPLGIEGQFSTRPAAAAQTLVKLLGTGNRFLTRPAVNHYPPPVITEQKAILAFPKQGLPCFLEESRSFVVSCWKGLISFLITNYSRLTTTMLNSNLAGSAFEANCSFLIANGSLLLSLPAFLKRIIEKGQGKPWGSPCPHLLGEILCSVSPFIYPLIQRQDRLRYPVPEEPLPLLPAYLPEH